MSKFLIAIIIAMGGVGYLYYQDTQAKMSVLVENNAKLEIAIQTSEEAMKSLQRDLEAANKTITAVNEEFNAIRQQNQVLSNKLSRHDIGMLAAAKPGLIEKTINKASSKAGRCFELLSGAELTEEEKNATSAKAFNSECPWLWTGSVQ